MFVPSSPQNNLALYPCPPGYCRCSHDSSVGNSTCVYSYSHSDPDKQCNCDRRGENKTDYSAWRLSNLNTIGTEDNLISEVS